MKFLTVPLVYLCFSFVLADNNDPVVLVHGLAGSPLNWQYANEIEDEGLEVIKVDIGKFTSAHDRAAEIFAQLKGTVVDYGVCHSQQFGHNRFGADYTGQALFSNWNENNRVHLIGHSFGGPTIVLLEKLLREGSGCSLDTSELYTGGNKNWITSITGFSGVFSGTTLLDTFNDLNVLEFLTNLVVVFGGVTDDTFVELLINADFDHWGLEKIENENFFDFWQRVSESTFVSPDNTDISTYDLSIQGTREINNFGQLSYAETYYFSHAAEKTNGKKNCFFFSCSDEYQVPSLFMNLLLQPFALIMGSLNEQEINRRNDGLVNFINQICPIVNENQRSGCQRFNGNWQPGVWNYLEVDDLDHLSIVFRDPVKDVLQFQKSAKKLYVDHARRLKQLPSN